MAKKGTGSVDNTAPSTMDEAWDAEVVAVDQLLSLAKTHKAIVTAIGSSRKRAKFRASEAAAKMREAIAEALSQETRAFKDWTELADQPSLFSEDQMAPASTFSPSRNLKPVN